jgi:hypothetical protein
MTANDNKWIPLKNKTLAVWLCLLGGPLGLHRFYLRGLGDALGWLLPIPTALGLYGIERIQRYGIDDRMSWVLVPLVGFTIAACALNAIVYGLMSPEEWNSKFNRLVPSPSSAGTSNWLTIGALVAALMIGSTSLIASIAFAIQGYFQS